MRDDMRVKRFLRARGEVELIGTYSYYFRSGHLKGASMPEEPEPQEPEDEWPLILPKKELSENQVDVLELMLGPHEGEDGVEKLAPGVWRVPGGWV